MNIRRNTSGTVQEMDLKPLNSVLRFGKKTLVSFEKEPLQVATETPSYITSFEIGGGKGILILSEEAFKELENATEPNIPTVQSLIKKLS